jgi:hypothetical protein
VFRLGKSAPPVTTLTWAQTAAATLHFLGQVSGNRSRTLSMTALSYNNAARCRLGADCAALMRDYRPSLASPLADIALWDHAQLVEPIKNRNLQPVK